MVRNRLLAGLLLLTAVQCTPAPPAGARAKIITQKRELIGGPHALGDLGDYLLENTDVRFILQQPGFSRGFGVFGGGLIDADIQRPIPPGDENGARGMDNFAEAFPAFFLVAMEPREIRLNRERKAAMEILPDAGDGSASIIVRGRPNQFLALTETINNALVSPEFLLFETTYKLPATGRTLEITTRVYNEGNEVATFKNKQFTGSVSLDVPFGDVLLFGAGNRVFAPGDGGFDLRYRLQQRYKENIQLPALPGLVVDYLATQGDDVSYGFFLPTDVPPPAQGDSHPNFVMDHAALYGSKARPGSILVPFIASAFTGVFHTQGPNRLAPGEVFEFRRYFSVGNGDVASITQEVYRVRNQAHGTLAGRVVDSVTQSPVRAHVIAIDQAGQPVCEAATHDGGQFTMPLPAGRYQVLVRARGRDLTTPVDVEVKTGLTTGLDLQSSPGARISVLIRDDAGAALPAKVTVVGTYDAQESNRDPKKHLFNLSVGEEWRGTDLIPDTADPATRRYLEGVFHTNNGAVTGTIRPGTYDVYVSRGPEYDVHIQTVTVLPGGSAELAATLRRTVDTSGYVSADFHIHSVKSIDSSVAEDPRVISYAAEGVEVMVSTDHNYVTDYAPTIARLGLDTWMRSFVGLELTTLEMGHFNGFPLRYDVTPATHGSFEWSSRTPDEIFNSIRDLGINREETIVQVNHPRDTILGYFNQFVWDQDDAVALGQSDPLLGVNVANYPNFAKENFSLDFDAIEVFNGKRFEYLHNYVIPDPLPPPPLADPVEYPSLVPGTVMRDFRGNIAFPGVIEDWFQLLRLGHRHAGVANSDSHTPVYDEAGYPRSYVRAASDVPGRLGTSEMVRSIRAMDVVLTNGPFIAFDVEGAGMGALATANAGQVHVKGEVRTAPWVRPDTLIIFENGRNVRQLAIPLEARVFAFDEVIPVTGNDTFIVLEVRGGDSMFPVVPTFDEPPLLINDAIGAIGGSLGFGGDSYGNVRPPIIFPITPFAITNPVFVDVNGNARFDPPGIAGGQGRVPFQPTPGQVDIPTPGIGRLQGPLNLWELMVKPVPGQAADIRRVFQAFGHHHGNHE